jgi:hypothetical protein
MVEYIMFQEDDLTFMIVDGEWMTNHEVGGSESWASHMLFYVIRSDIRPSESWAHMTLGIGKQGHTLRPRNLMMDALEVAIKINTGEIKV